MSDQHLHSSPLGQQSAYIDTYDKALLFPILRQPKREAIGIGQVLPFKGYDVWTAFELSWLNAKGKPMVALADIIIPCESKNIIESKSFKLYLNSFNNTLFEKPERVRDTLISDLSHAAGLAVDVTLIFEPRSIGTEANVINATQTPFVGNELGHHATIGRFDGFCIDDLDVMCTQYTVNPELLHTSVARVQNKKIYSNLLKSNCLVTGQPDWGSVQIVYSGPCIDLTSLLQYIVSYRNHNEFHEQCVERIFMDIQTHCQPDELTVYARYTRRGGLDINPLRSTHAIKPPENRRLFRQ